MKRKISIFAVLALCLVLCSTIALSSIPQAEQEAPGVPEDFVPPEDAVYDPATGEWYILLAEDSLYLGTAILDPGTSLAPQLPDEDDLPDSWSWIKP